MESPTHRSRATTDTGDIQQRDIVPCDSMDVFCPRRVSPQPCARLLLSRGHNTALEIFHVPTSDFAVKLQAENGGRPLPPRPEGVAAGAAMSELGAKSRFKRVETGADAEPSGSRAPQVRCGLPRRARFRNPSYAPLTSHPFRRVSTLSTPSTRGRAALSRYREGHVRRCCG
jgi:hypothetical protein